MTETTSHPHPGGGDLAAGFEPVVIERAGLDWEARGTRAALLAAGLCAPAHFPAGRKRVSCGGHEAGRVWALELHARGVWHLRIYRTWEDRQREAAQAEAAASAAGARDGRIAFLLALLHDAPDRPPEPRAPLRLVWSAAGLAR